MAVVVVILLAIAVILWFLPLTITISFRQRAWAAEVDVQVKAPLVKIGKRVNVTENVTMVLEHLLKRWRATGEPVKVPLQKTVRRAPRGKLMGSVSRPLRYLGRRTRCSRLDFHAEIGGFDAMQSAMLAGLFWSVIGTGLAMAGRWLQLDPATPQIKVAPVFAGPAWRLDSTCILRLQFGHAIVAGVWVLRRVMREKEVLAWARDSWRRKGEEGDGRASDSGPDEDGHGEPERHG